MRWVLLAVLFLVAATARAELPSASPGEIDKALAGGKPTVIDLGSRSCLQCRKMAPALESLAAELRGRANVLFIDVREDDTAARRFRVQMIPTQIFFNARGKEITRHIGFMDKSDVQKGLKGAGLQ